MTGGVDEDRCPGRYGDRRRQFDGVGPGLTLPFSGRAGAHRALTVLSALAIVISIAFAAGVVTVLNNDSAVERIEQEVDKMRDQLPTSVEVPQP